MSGQVESGTERTELLTQIFGAENLADAGELLAEASLDHLRELLAETDAAERRAEGMSRLQAIWADDGKQIATTRVA